jgi:CelD/BcsL family acetyltransferase involved in cellulose biosynthesis
MRATNSVVKWQIADSTEFPQVAAAWDELVATQHLPPILESRFVEAALQELLDAEHRLALAFDGARLVAAGILVRVGWARWASFQPSQLPLGIWLMTPGLDWQLALRSLCSALPAPVLMISITQQDPLMHPRPADSGRLSTLDYIDTAWVEIRGSFDAFWEARGRNLKQNLRKQRRRIESAGQVLTVELATDPQRVATVFAEFVALESRGWKAQAGTAVTVESAQGRFYARALANFAHCGRALCIALRLDGRAIAADMCVRTSSSTVILKTAFDEERSALSPGQLLHEEAFRHFFATPGLTRVEFFGRVMDWHTRWTELRRTLYHVNFYRWGALRSLHERLRAWRQSSAEPAPSSGIRDHVGDNRDVCTGKILMAAQLDHMVSPLTADVPGAAD